MRQSGRGAVRRLLFAATLALLALVPAWSAPPAVAAADRLPNLKAARPSDFHIVMLNGRRVLRFTSILVNVGAGPMEVLARRPSSSSPWNVFQVIDNDAGGERRINTDATLHYAGDGHNHWHVEKMMAYHLWSGRGTRADRKVGFCFFDTTLWAPDLPRSPSSPYYRESWCGSRTALTSRTGISVGWADTYGWRLAYQWIDITGLPGGTYTVRAISDPREWFLETDETDGCGWTKVSFGSTGTSVKVVSSGRGCINDWQGSTYETQIAWAYANAITGGCDLDLFCTGNAVPRIQMAMFIDRAMHLPATDQDFFTDDEGLTGEASVNRLAAAGITGGCATDRYCPNEPVTRAQMAAFLVRALDLPPPVEPDHFIDDDTSTHEADIDSLFEAGITTGCAISRYCPNASVTRGQMATFLYRAFSTPPPEG
jgi:Lysyl oxidase/S-layer homology domain